MKTTEENAKELSQCSDIMPKTLSDHQKIVYHACLDMAYICEKAQREEFKKMVDDLERITHRGMWWVKLERVNRILSQIDEQ